MLPKRSYLLLNAIIITFLASSSYAALAGEAAPTASPTQEAPAPKSKISDRWLKREPQKTASQEAADAAREARMKEMRGTIAQRNGGEVTPEAVKISPEPTKKPVEKPGAMPEEKMASTPSLHVKPVPPKAPSVAPEKKRMTLREQIAHNKKKRADELLKNAEELKKKREMEKAKAPAAPHVAKHEAKPEVKHEAMPEVKHEAKPEVKHEVKPEVKSEEPLHAGPTQKKLMEQLEANKVKAKEEKSAAAMEMKGHPDVVESKTTTLSMPKLEVQQHPDVVHESTTTTLSMPKMEAKQNPNVVHESTTTTLSMPKLEAKQNPNVVHESSETTLTLNKENAAKLSALAEKAAPPPPAPPLPPAASPPPPPPPPAPKNLQGGAGSQKGGEQSLAAQVLAKRKAMNLDREP